MAADLPYHTLFETFGRASTAHADAVNAAPRERLLELLRMPLEAAGRCILLRAPRAGHGKTHLLSSVARSLGASYEFIPVHEGAAGRVDAGSILGDVMRSLIRPLPAGGGLCVLDLITRHWFALALQPLVASGEVPCQDREGALAALRTRPVETFDFHHPNAVTAHWARENFDILGQRLAMELARRSGQALRDVVFWVEGLFGFATAPIEQAGRVQRLVQALESGAALAMDRLVALLGLLTQLMRVVLVADEVEGLSANESEALRLASLLTSLRQHVDRLDVILSINQDIWQGAFVPRLSGGLLDRLSESVIDLQPLTREETLALLESRAPGHGERVLRFLKADGSYARGVLKAATAAWFMAEEAGASKLPVTMRQPQEEKVGSGQQEVVSSETGSPVCSSASSSEASLVKVAEGPPAAPTHSVSDAPTDISQAADEGPDELPRASAASASVGHESTGEQASPDRVDELLRRFRERYGR